MAERLGIDLRSTDTLEDLGTTFLLIEPTVRPDDLSTAIARNWWPALEDGRMTVTVSADGRTSVPRPMKDPILRTFVDAYHLASTDQDNAKPNQYRQSFRRASFGDRTLKLGGLGLVAEPGGWSYENGVDEPDEVQHRSLVALVRGPRMVVEYLDVGQARPFVRGAFVADDEVDELLRQTEPKAHDSWQTRIEEAGSDPDAPQVAEAVTKAACANTYASSAISCGRHPAPPKTSDSRNSNGSSGGSSPRPAPTPQGRRPANDPSRSSLKNDSSTLATG